jgi:hypothetical protein
MQGCLIRKGKVAEMLGVCNRTIDNYAALHELRREQTGEPTLASSPINGLFSIRLGASLPQTGSNTDDGQLIDTRQRRYHEKDALEYAENSTLEMLRLPLKNWRAEGRNGRR